MSEQYDSRSDPEIVLADIPEGSYKTELEILDRFQVFTAELLRLSLLGIAAFGFLYEQVFADLKMPITWENFICNPKVASVCSIFFFSLSTFFALAHRFLSTEAQGFYIHVQRLTIRNSSLMKEKNEVAINKKPGLETELKKWMVKRNKYLTKCSKMKLASTFSLGIGAAFLGYSLILIVLK